MYILTVVLEYTSHLDASLSAIMTKDNVSMIYRRVAMVPNYAEFCCFSSQASTSWFARFEVYRRTAARKDALEAPFPRLARRTIDSS